MDTWLLHIALLPLAALFPTAFLRYSAFAYDCASRGRSGFR